MAFVLCFFEKKKKVKIQLNSGKTVILNPVK